MVDGAVYRWGFIHGYLRTPEPFRTLDVFTAYAEGNHANPLRMEFNTWEDLYRGAPLHSGLLPLEPNDPEPCGINLHTPKWAVLLIREGLKHGWQPNAKSAPFVLTDGVGIIKELKKMSGEP